MSKIRMIGLDLDGTLLNENKELTEYTRKVLAQAIEQGVIVLVATGRPATGVPQVLRELPGMRYMLTSNGGRILDMHEEKIIYECPVPYDSAVRILRIFEEYDTLREIYFDGQGYVQEDELARTDHYVPKAPMAAYIRNTRKTVPDIWEKMQEMQGRGLDKVHGIFANQEEKREAEEKLAALGGLSVSGSLGNNLEVNAEGVNKGTGLLKLGALLGIQREEIMAFGDGGNDLEMLRAVGFGVAMENATEEVKAAADYITLSNEEDGVAKAIEKFVLN